MADVPRYRFSTTTVPGAVVGDLDPATLEYVARLLGDEEVMQSSVTREERGERPTTGSTGYRSLAPAHVLREVRPGEGGCWCMDTWPSQLTLRMV